MGDILKPPEKQNIVKIATKILNRSGIVTLIAKFPSYVSGNHEHLRKEWVDVEQIVIKKFMEVFPQSEPSNEKIASVTRIMGWQILKWMEDHFHIAKNFRLSTLTPSEFVWSQCGTIDRKETAKLLVGDQSVDPATRYALAFIYCLECDIRAIWNSIPEDNKFPIYKTEHNPGVINERNLADFWTHVPDLDGSFEVGSGSNEKAFRKAVQFHIKAAAEYFLPKLNSRDREVCLVDEAQGLPEVETLCFLLSQMDEEQRMRFFQRNSKSVREKILQWPWFIFYDEMANHTWNSLPTYADFLSPLTALIDRNVNKDYEDEIYRKLFKELWMCACERFGADVCATKRLLCCLFEIKDKDNIGIIFQDVFPAVKKEWILSDCGLNISAQLMTENDQELLEFFQQQ